MNICAVRRGKFLSTMAALLLLAELAVVSAQGQTDSRVLVITNCGTNILNAGKYVLANDLNCAADGIDISASGVELNLAGHRITGSSAAAAGISVSFAATGDVQILGPGTIQGFGVGVSITQDFEAIVHVTGVTSNGARSIGFDVRNAKAILRGNTATGSQTGFHLSLSDNSEVSGNTASWNSGSGFSIASSNEQVMHNTALNTGGSGIATLSGTSRSQITNNTAMHNNGSDLFEGNGNCANLWASNTFGTKNRTCIR